MLRSPTSELQEEFAESFVWQGLYERNSVKVLQYVRRLVGRSFEPLAEDLTHETFVVAFANWKKFRASSSESTWLCGIAYNLARRHQLREALKSRALVDLGSHVPLPEPDALQIRRERASSLEQAAGALPEKLREAFVLHVVHGLSAREAAHELGVSEGNVRVRVTRARAVLREHLSRPPPAPSKSRS
jgi:RNA polymerase sigma-70 factor (ECF subfamily)